MVGAAAAGSVFLDPGVRVYVPVGKRSPKSTAQFLCTFVCASRKASPVGTIAARLGMMDKRRLAVIKRFGRSQAASRIARCQPTARRDCTL